MTNSIDQKLKNIAHQEESVKIPDIVKNKIDETLSIILNNEVKPTRFKMIYSKNNYLKAVAAIAVIIAVIFTITAPNYPALAQKLRSIFVGHTVDNGLLKAEEYGLVYSPNIKVSDKGYTLRIEEAAADPARVVVALQLYDNKGKHDRKILSLLKDNQIVVKNENKEVIGIMRDVGKTDDYYYLEAVFPEPVLSNKLTIEGDITALGADNTDKIIGDWSFSFNMDIEQAHRATSTTIINKSYTSPSGMTITVKSLTWMVQGVRLEIDTQLSKEALSRSSDELWKNQRLMYHFEDIDGNEIHSVNTRKSPSQDSLISQSHVPGNTPGVMHSSFTFIYLPEDKPFQFVLDGVSIQENDGSSIKVDPAQLKDHPIKFPTGNEDNIVLNDFYFKEIIPGEKQSEVGAIAVSGTIVSDQRFDKWSLMDDSGNKYKIYSHGASSEYGDGWKNGVIELSGGRPGESHEFHAEGFKSTSRNFTLIREMIGRRYMDVDWRMELKK